MRREVAKGLCLIAFVTVAAAAGTRAADVIESPLRLEGQFDLTPRISCLDLQLGAASRLANGAHALKIYDLPIANSVPGISDIDGAGYLWFVMGGGGFAGIPHPPLSYIGKMDRSGRLSVYRLPSEGALPNGIRVHGGKVFVTEYKGGRIAVIDPTTNTVREYRIPSAQAHPTGLAVNSKGELWFNENNGNKIGRLTRRGEIIERPIPTGRSRPTGMVVDARDHVWFAEMAGNKIGRISNRGVLTEFAVPTPQARPTAMVETADGSIWFSERAANRIGVVAGERVLEHEIPWPDTGPFFLVDGGDGGVWFTQLYASAIGRIDTATKAFTRVILPVQRGWPGGLAFDPNGNLWISLQLTNQVAVISHHEECRPT